MDIFKEDEDIQFLIYITENEKRLTDDNYYNLYCKYTKQIKDKMKQKKEILKKGNYVVSVNDGIGYNAGAYCTSEDSYHMMIIDNSNSKPNYLKIYGKTATLFCSRNVCVERRIFTPFRYWNNVLSTILAFVVFLALIAITILMLGYFIPAGILTIAIITIIIGIVHTALTQNIIKDCDLKKIKTCSYNKGIRDYKMEQIDGRELNEQFVEIMSRIITKSGDGEESKELK